MMITDLDAALQRSPATLLELGKNYDSRTDFPLHSTEWLTHIYPKFIHCTTYAERIDFFEKHDLLDYLTLNVTNSVNQFHYKGVFLVSPQALDWESVIRSGFITLAPLTAGELDEFIAWALVRRPTMQAPIYIECAPYSSETMIEAFRQRFTSIKSSLDRADFLQERRAIALEWKNLSTTDGLYELHYIPKGNWQTLQVHLQVYTHLMCQLKWGKTIRLTDYYTPGHLLLSWSILDTYLLAKANYEFALFVEEFTSESIPLPLGQPAAQSGMPLSRSKQPRLKVTPYRPELTVRENILIICYEDKIVICKEQPDYNKYIQYCTKAKRLAYPNESIHKLRPLIQAIKNILSYLSEDARKRADEDLDALNKQLLKRDDA